MVKNGHETLAKWMKLADFLHADTYSGKLEVTLIVIGWAWSNMVVGCISRMNEYIGLIFCMLEVM